MTASAEQRRRLDSVGPLALIGAGKMGVAMLEGWLALGLDPKNVAVFEPQPSEQVLGLARKGLSLNPPKDAITNFAAVIVAVKPQTAPEIAAGLVALATANTLVLSIMAGRTLGFLQHALPRAAIVRAMPNTPGSIGRGITVAVANARVTAAQRELAVSLLAALGTVEWVNDESLMDAVTAVSGSGPAYVFLLAEALAKAGVASGLPAPLADRLARETVAGAGELLHRSNLDAASLRKNVTSPGGTTASALEVLLASDGLEPLMRRAVAAATRRSRELGG
jgi:pyrroline-5-carboxylate reductase